MPPAAPPPPPPDHAVGSNVPGWVLPPPAFAWTLPVPPGAYVDPCSGATYTPPEVALQAARPKACPTSRFSKPVAEMSEEEVTSNLLDILGQHQAALSKQKTEDTCIY